MYVCIAIILNGLTKRGTTEIITKPWSFRQGFLHSNQNDARAFKHQCLPGSFKELSQI